MRISKDKTSWHAHGVIAKDARHTKSPDEVPAHRVKKDTKKWCKGKEGVEHKPKWYPLPVRWWYPKGHRRWEKRCETCGRRYERTENWEQVRKENGGVLP